MRNLWSTNSPQRFWRCLVDFPADVWDQAIAEAAPVLGLCDESRDIEIILCRVLGEGQFGTAHWQIGPAKRLYYRVKPWIPRCVTRVLRRWYGGACNESHLLRWPVEDRYARFQWTVMQRVMTLTGRLEVPFIHFWPGGCRCALVLTHDVETAVGQENVRRVADLETSLGFRSSFNFVPERYRLDDDLLHDLRERGFEIGVHGLKHDGKLFTSHEEFVRRAGRINDWARRMGIHGFRAPLTHRQPEWMQCLDVEYDLSFFDTDPYEPIPGGTMSIWPFRMGHLMELPYTLPQDYTLTAIVGERSASMWLEKVAFLESFHGMILVIAHPDYLSTDDTFRLYTHFLQDLWQREAYWHALPREVARWWRERMDATPTTMPQGATLGTLRQTDGRLEIQ